MWEVAIIASFMREHASMCVRVPWKARPDEAPAGCAAQNAIVFQAFGIASRLLRADGGNAAAGAPPLTYPQVFLSGAALQAGL